MKKRQYYNLHISPDKPKEEIQTNDEGKQEVKKVEIMKGVRKKRKNMKLVVESSEKKETKC